MSTPIAGWYDDPASTGMLRFFDGRAWTDLLRPRPAHLPPAAAPAAETQPVAAPAAPSAASEQPHWAAAAPANAPAAPIQPPAQAPTFFLGEAPAGASPFRPSTPTPDSPGLIAQADVAAHGPSGAPAAPERQQRSLADPSAAEASSEVWGAALSGNMGPRPQASEENSGFFLATGTGLSYASGPDPSAWGPDANLGAALTHDPFGIGPYAPGPTGEIWSPSAGPSTASWNAAMGASALSAAPAGYAGGWASAPAAQPSMIVRLGAPLARRTASLVSTLAMVAGIVGVGAFGWNLYGSNQWESYKQSRLNTELVTPTLGLEASGSLATAPVKPAPGQPAPTKPTAAQVAAPPPPGAKAAPVQAGTLVQTGAPTARIKIPSIGVDRVLLMGTDRKTLTQGPGIWKAGVFPGLPGNATLSGHRTTHGAPFRKIDRLRTGDRITITVPGQPDAVYEVRAQFKVLPSQVSVTHQTPGVRLTLTTCDPVGSAAKRLVVQAELVEGKHVAKALPAAKWQPQR